MTPSTDDILESESYFNRRFNAAKVAEREQRKARRERNEAQKTDQRPEHGEQLLRRIIADPSESTSVRMDARRLLEVFDMRPRDFPRELDDFLAWRSETKQ